MHSVGQLIYAVWTNNGANEAGLADAMFDGRIDALCRYITGDDTDDRDCGVGFVNHDGSATAVVTTVPSSKDASDASIDHVHCKDLSYETFCDAYMLQNRPLIIDGLTDAWDCRLRWVRPKDGKPDMKYISDTFGSCRAPVFEQASQGFSLSRPVSTEMTVGDYCKWWEHQQSQPLPNNTNDKGNDRLLYLKDWKFVADVPHHTEVYTCPHFFQDDWLNQAMQSGYKFVYLGPQGTSTVLHADVMRSYSWSSNICGEKRWHMVPPQYAHLLYDCFGRQLASHLHLDVDFPGLSVLYPGLARARRVAIEVVQRAGETIFVPSNWFHTVENLQDTLSINHNWFNGYNIRYVWQHVESEVRNYQNSRNDVQEESIHGSGDGSLEEDVSMRLAAGNAQVIEDVQLLWQVIATKAATVLSKTSQPPGMSSRATIADMEAIVRILDGLLVLLMRSGSLGEQLSLPLVHTDTVRALKVSLASLLHEARLI